MDDRARVVAERFFYYERFENSETPCIVRESACGGDPRIIAHVSRVYDASALCALCALANANLPAPDPRAGVEGRYADIEDDYD